MKHTPGPWTLKPYDLGEEGGLLVAGPDNFPVAIIEFSPDDSPYKGREVEDKANANLIAAAPQMLDELKHAHRIIQALINITTEDQRAEISKLDEGEGALRYHARAEAIAKAII
jgi:hypothetical protein